MKGLDNLLQPVAESLGGGFRMCAELPTYIGMQLAYLNWREGTWQSPSASSRGSWKEGWGCLTYLFTHFITYLPTYSGMQLIYLNWREGIWQFPPACSRGSWWGVGVMRCAVPFQPILSLSYQHTDHWHATYLPKWTWRDLTISSSLWPRIFVGRLRMCDVPFQPISSLLT